MKQTNTRPTSNDPPQETPMSIVPKQDPLGQKIPQQTDPVTPPVSPEVPKSEGTPEEPENDPFDDGNFPI